MTTTGRPRLADIAEHRDGLVIVGGEAWTAREWTVAERKRERKREYRRRQLADDETGMTPV